MNIAERTFISPDNNIDELRKRHPEGLRFVVGDTHGETKTLRALMEKIRFDSQKDHVYFVGDYNGGGNVMTLLQYMAPYYQADHSQPGFHMIRGNHEWELYPTYTLENLPDIIVIRAKNLVYYLAHAGMIASVLDLIHADMQKNPEQTVFAYRFDPVCVAYDAPLRQMIWSRHGFYSQKSHWKLWPDEASLLQKRACIIHGHSPYCFFKKENYFSYGDNNLYWQNQHIFFSEELQSFNIDSNIKGRFENGEGHRGLTCVCLEGIEDAVEQNDGWLTSDGIKNAENFVFSVDHVYQLLEYADPHVDKITAAEPKAKRITLDQNQQPVLSEENL